MIRRVTKSTLDKYVRYLSSVPMVSFDTETTGLYPFHGDTAFAFIFATDKDEYYFDFTARGLKRKAIKKLQPIFNDPERYMFFVNAKFDVAMTEQEGIDIKCKLVDCAALARVEYNKHKADHGDSFLSMDYMAEHYLNQRKDSAVEQYIKSHGLYKLDVMGEKAPDYMAVPPKLIIPYACKDVRLTYDIAIEIIRRIKEADRENKDIRPDGYGTLADICRNEVRFTRTICNIQRTGLLCDVLYTEKALIHEEKVAARAEREVRRKLGKQFNLRSPKQITKYIIEDCNLTLPRKLIKGEWKGNYKTDEKTLSKLDVPIVQKIIEAKQAQKKANTYYKNFLKFKDKNDIIHTNLNQEVARTGRTSSTSPNFQNLSKEKRSAWMVRHSIIAPPDFELFFFDWRKQEMHVMVDQAGEMGVLRQMENGVNFYQAAANEVKRIARIELEYAKAKAIALGLAYGEGLDLLASNLGCTKEQASKFKHAFFRGLPAVLKLKTYLEQQVRYYGKIFNPYGRVLYFSRDESYKALNGFAQGTSADMAKRACNMIDERLRKKRSKLINLIHDEMKVMIHKSERSLVKYIQEDMCKAYPYKHLPIGADVEWSPTSWGAKEPYERVS